MFEKKPHDSTIAGGPPPAEPVIPVPLPAVLTTATANAALATPAPVAAPTATAGTSAGAAASTSTTAAAAPKSAAPATTAAVTPMSNAGVNRPPAAAATAATATAKPVPATAPVRAAGGGPAPSAASTAASAAAAAAMNADAAIAASRAARRARKVAALAAGTAAADKAKTAGYVLPAINPNALQRFVLYETKSRFYLVGSNRTQTRYRVLKLDRSEAHELSVVADPTVYNASQIHDVLGMLKNQTTKATTCYGVIGFIRFVLGYYIHIITGIRHVASLGGHLIYAVESTELIPLVHPSVYDNQTKFPKPNLKRDRAQESRYRTLYHVMDLTKDFYFSYTYDLTHSLQHNMLNATPRVSLHPTPTPNAHTEKPNNSNAAPATAGAVGASAPSGYTSFGIKSSQPATVAPSSAPALDQKVDQKDEKQAAPSAAAIPPPAAGALQPKSMYVWNHFLLESFEFVLGGDREWSTRLMHGFVEQTRCSVWGRELTLTLVSRRSRFFAGTRYLKRGLNDTGHVANDVETEQILHDRTTGDSIDGAYTAHVQLRASIPLFWTQESNAMVAKPAIVVQKVDPLHLTTRLHFEDLFTRYGSPVLALNLVKQHEKRARETVIGGRFGEAVQFINEFLPQQHKIDYYAWDFKEVSRSKTTSIVDELSSVIGHWALQRNGLFHSHPAAGAVQASGDATKHFNPTRANIKQNLDPYKNIAVLQRGVMRCNCIDSLDRTNVAQFCVGKCALGYQLYGMGLIDSNQTESSSEIVNILLDMYERMGDSLAMQYGGSQMHRQMKKDRNKTLTMAPVLYRQTNVPNKPKEMFVSLMRHYQNSFQDTGKQDAINLFLGYFIPVPHYAVGMEPPPAVAAAATAAAAKFVPVATPSSASTAAAAAAKAPAPATAASGTAAPNTSATAAPPTAAAAKPALSTSSSVASLASGSASSSDDKSANNSPPESPTVPFKYSMRATPPSASASALSSATNSKAGSRDASPTNSPLPSGGRSRALSADTTPSAPTTAAGAAAAASGSASKPPSTPAGAGTKPGGSAAAAAAAPFPSVMSPQSVTSSSSASTNSLSSAAAAGGGGVPATGGGLSSTASSYNRLPDIWDLGSDYYLHNRTVADAPDVLGRAWFYDDSWYRTSINAYEATLREHALPLPILTPPPFAHLDAFRRHKQLNRPPGAGAAPAPSHAELMAAAAAEAERKELRHWERRRLRARRVLVNAGLSTNSVIATSASISIPPATAAGSIAGAATPQNGGTAPGTGSASATPSSGGGNSGSITGFGFGEALDRPRAIAPASNERRPGTSAAASKRPAPIETGASLSAAAAPPPPIDALSPTAAAAAEVEHKQKAAAAGAAAAAALAAQLAAMQQKSAEPALHPIAAAALAAAKEQEKASENERAKKQKHDFKVQTRVRFESLYPRAEMSAFDDMLADALNRVKLVKVSGVNEEKKKGFGERLREKFVGPATPKSAASGVQVEAALASIGLGSAPQPPPQSASKDTNSSSKPASQSAAKPTPPPVPATKPAAGSTPAAPTPAAAPTKPQPPPPPTVPSGSSATVLTPTAHPLAVAAAAASSAQSAAGPHPPSAGSSSSSGSGFSGNRPAFGTTPEPLLATYMAQPIAPPLYSSPVYSHQSAVPVPCRHCAALYPLPMGVTVWRCLACATKNELPGSAAHASRTLHSHMPPPHYQPLTLPPQSQVRSVGPAASGAASVPPTPSAAAAAASPSTPATATTPATTAGTNTPATPATASAAAAVTPASTATPNSSSSSDASAPTPASPPQLAATPSSDASAAGGASVPSLSQQQMARIQRWQYEQSQLHAQHLNAQLSVQQFPLPQPLQIRPAVAPPNANLSIVSSVTITTPVAPTTTASALAGVPLPAVAPPPTAVVTAPGSTAGGGAANKRWFYHLLNPRSAAMQLAEHKLLNDRSEPLPVQPPPPLSSGGAPHRNALAGGAGGASAAAQLDPKAIDYRVLQLSIDRFTDPSLEGLLIAEPSAPPASTTAVTAAVATPGLGAAIPLSRSDPDNAYWFERYVRASQFDDAELASVFRMAREDSCALPLSVDLSVQAAASYTAYMRNVAPKEDPITAPASTTSSQVPIAAS